MMSLEKIDTSFWLTKDKTWMEERHAQWLAIEKSVSLDKNKPEVNVIKQYFLKGKMPNWRKYRDMNKQLEHLDLRFFLWLHPSSNPDVLKPLYISYMQSDLIQPLDVAFGYRAFLGHELVRATSPYKSLADYPFPFLGEKNIILFRIMFEDIDYVKDVVYHLYGGQEKFDRQPVKFFDYLGYDHFLFMKRWLLQESTLPLSLYGLYQYDEVLEWCLTTLTEKNKQEFLDTIQNPKSIQGYQKALYCIHHFDTEKEDDNFRARAVYKMRDILEQHDFVPEFKQMWEDIKAGKIDVENPWVY